MEQIKPLVIPKGVAGSYPEMTYHWVCKNCGEHVKFTCCRWSKENDPYYLNQMDCGCSQCELEIFKKESMAPSYNKFDSLSSEQKRDVLRKRSQEHTKKTRGELRRQMDSNKLTGMYNRKDIGIDNDPKI